MTLAHRGIALATAVAMALGSFPVNAATVSNKAGTVLVSKGEGFVPLSGDMELAPGGRVMVKADGLATIAYASGCTVRVGSGFWVVQDASPCTQGTSELDFTRRMNDGVMSKEEPPPPDRTMHGLIIGGLVVGGAVLSCIFWWCKDKDGKPASP